MKAKETDKRAEQICGNCVYFNKSYINDYCINPSYPNTYVAEHKEKCKFFKPIEDETR